MNIYEKLIETIKTLFEESLSESEASFDDLVSMIEMEIEKELGDKHSLQDYILVHDPWKTRDRITATTKRRSIIFYHQSHHEKVSKFKRIFIKQFVDEFINDSLDEETLEEAYSRNFISKMIEFHPLGHIDTHNVYTSNYQVKNDINIQHKYFNLIKKYKRDLDAYKNQIDDHIFNNIMEYKVLAVDENYRSDSYVFVPLNKALSKNEIEESVKFIYDEVTKVFIGIKYNQKFYPRFDIWMSLNDSDLPNFETYSTKEFTNEKYLLEDDLYDFRDYLKNASHDVRDSLDLKKETNEYNDSLLNSSNSTLSVIGAGIDYEIYFLTENEFNVFNSKNISIYDIDYQEELRHVSGGQLIFDIDDEFWKLGYFDCYPSINILNIGNEHEFSIKFKLVNEKIESMIIKDIFENINSHTKSDYILIHYRLEKGLELYKNFKHKYNENTLDFFEENIKLISYKGFSYSFEFKNEEIFFDEVEFFRTKGEYVKLVKINEINEVEFFDFEE